jgi:hypothetical protein
MTILPTAKILAGENPNGYREYGGKKCQVLISHEAEEIHFLSSDMCLHGHIKGFAGISNPRILG